MISNKGLSEIRIGEQEKEETAGEGGLLYSHESRLHSQAEPGVKVPSLRLAIR